MKWRKRFKLATVIGVGDNMTSGWAVMDNGEIAAFYTDRNHAKYIARRANKRGFL